MAALRFLGGDAAVGLGRTVDELVDPLEEGLRLAADLGDRRAEADFSSRLAILEASRLRLTTALARAERSVARARAADSEDALVLALDGLKSVLAYLGDPEPLGEVVADLEPRVRARGNTWLLQWVVFESSFVPAAEGRLDAARARVAEAIELNRLSGFPAYAGYLAAHDGWYARLSGDLDAARAHRPQRSRGDLAGQPPVVVRHRRRPARRHPGRDRRPGRGRGRRAARAGGGRDRDGRRAAALPGRRRRPRRRGRPRAEATRLLDEVECPPGHAWVTGADVYLLLDRPDLLAPAIKNSWPHLATLAG